MRKIVLCLAFVGLLGVVFAQEGGFVQEDAHEHGAALLNVVLDGETLSLELESPAVNLIGFEYEPVTDEEVQAVEAVLAQLEDGTALFIPAEAASCEFMSAEAEHLMTDEGHAEEHADEEHRDEEHADEGAQHSEFYATYSFTCSRPERLSSVELRELFTLYPGIADLDVQYVLPTAQGAAELSVDSTTLTF